MSPLNWEGQWTYFEISVINVKVLLRCGIKLSYSSKKFRTCKSRDYLEEVSAPDSSFIVTFLHVFTPSEESAIHTSCVVYYSLFLLYNRCFASVLPAIYRSSESEGRGRGGWSFRFCKAGIGSLHTYVIKNYVITSTCYLHYLCCDVYKKTNIAAAADVLFTLFIRCVQRTRTKNLHSCSYLFIHIHIMLCKYPNRL